MKAKKYVKMYALALVFGGIVFARPLFAAVPEGPAYGSPEAAMAAMAAVEDLAADTPVEVEDALAEVEDATQDLEDALATEDEDAIEDAQEKLSKAEEAYADVIAGLTGVDVATIEAMREDSMGWGAIANELGVQPGLLGLGNTNGSQYHGTKSSELDDVEGVDPDELADATERSLNSATDMGRDAHSSESGYGSGMAGENDMADHSSAGNGGTDDTGGGPGGAGGSDDSGSGGAGGSDAAGGSGNSGGDSGSDAGGHGGGPDGHR